MVAHSSLWLESSNNMAALQYHQAMEVSINLTNTALVVHHFSMTEQHTGKQNVVHRCVFQAEIGAQILCKVRNPVDHHGDARAAL